MIFQDAVVCRKPTFQSTDQPARIYVKFLNELADSGEIRPIEDLLARLTIDIIAHVVLDHDLNCQTSENELFNGLLGSIGCTPTPLSINPFKNLNPITAYLKRHYTRINDNYIKRVIRERLAKRASEQNSSSKKSFRRPAIDLAVDEFLLQGAEGGAVDANFEQVAIDQMKTFVFAGHDTTATAVCYMYHMLNLHPEALAKVRKEYDDVIGPTSGAADVIKARPAVLNELPYTMAIIKGK